MGSEPTRERLGEAVGAAARPAGKENDETGGAGGRVGRAAAFAAVNDAGGATITAAAGITVVAGRCWLLRLPPEAALEVRDTVATAESGVHQRQTSGELDILTKELEMSSKRNQGMLNRCSQSLDHQNEGLPPACFHWIGMWSCCPPSPLTKSLGS
ncbi:hypothetical protein KSP40_PGU021360 [Platanthera guangdongensis]|uniref:Uncharacterized protein n=1 Tax=Platanthera guangdongensis TaxID=2320717 RepID=A0ABR2LY49_9ASPA